MKKRFNIWAEESEIKKIKAKAKKERRSTNQFILNRALKTPNISTGDWWDDAEEIIQAIREVKEEEKKK